MKTLIIDDSTHQSQNVEHGLPDARWKDLYRIGFFSCAAIPVLIVEATARLRQRGRAALPGQHVVRRR